MLVYGDLSYTNKTITNLTVCELVVWTDSKWAKISISIFVLVNIILTKYFKYGRNQWLINQGNSENQNNIYKTYFYSCYHVFFSFFFFFHFYN